MAQAHGGHCQGRVGALPGRHYQADAGSAGEAIPHGADRIAGAGPLAIPRAFAHGIGAAASVVLRWGQERGSGDSQPSSALTSPGEGAASPKQLYQQCAGGCPSLHILTLPLIPVLTGVR